MKKVLTTILALTVIITVGLITTNTVSAQSTEPRMCVPGTGTNQVPCQPCIPGPYNICVPDTGLFDSLLDDEVTLEDLVPISLGLMVIGIVLIANGKLIKRKLK